jgi:hypothetical protein
MWSSHPFMRSAPLGERTLQHQGTGVIHMLRLASHAMYAILPPCLGASLEVLPLVPFSQQRTRKAYGVGLTCLPGSISMLSPDLWRSHGR